MHIPKSAQNTRCVSQSCQAQFPLRGEPRCCWLHHSWPPAQPASGLTTMDITAAVARCGWVGNTLDVKPTCCHVGCNQNLRISCSAAYLIAVALPPRWCETQVNLRLHPVENPTVITHWTWQSWIYGAFNLPDFSPPKASSRARWSFATELNIKESVGNRCP